MALAAFVHDLANEGRVLVDPNQKESEMELESMIPGKAGTSVLVNGTVYKVDSECIVHEVSEDDGAKLLQNPNWKLYTGESNRKGADRKAERKTEGLKLIDSTAPIWRRLNTSNVTESPSRTLRLDGRNDISRPG